MYNNLIENESFKLSDADNPGENLVVEISEGPYEGIKYSYGVVEFKIDNQNTDDENGSLSFEIYTNDPENQKLVEDPDFVKTAGDILMSILETSLETGDYKIGSEADTNTDSQESITE